MKGGTEVAYATGDFEERYDIRMAAAWTLGHARRTGTPALPDDVSRRRVDVCSRDELCMIVAAAHEAGLRLYPFKSDMQVLPRTRKTMGFLRSVPLESLLDVGSGRGAFLFPFMREFPWVDVWSLDILEHRVTFLEELADGGITHLHPRLGDVCDQPFADDSFDVVTMLEVLEHIPDVGAAVRASVAMARRHVVVSVPSRPDDNPEHIHLLTRERLTELFGAAGCDRLRFDGVEGHTFMVATLG